MMWPLTRMQTAPWSDGQNNTMWAELTWLFLYWEEMLVNPKRGDHCCDLAEWRDVILMHSVAPSRDDIYLCIIVLLWEYMRLWHDKHAQKAREGKKTKNHQHLSVKMPVNVTTHPREFIYNSASMSALGEEHQWSNQHLSARHMLQRMNSGRADVWRRGNLQQQHSCHTCGATDDKVPDADDDRATVGWQEMTQEMAHLAGNSYMLGKYYSLTYSGSKSPELKELFN